MLGRSRFGTVLLLLLLAIGGSLISTGCGGKSDSSNNGGGQKTVIRFWHFQSEPDQRKAIEKRVAAFEAANPTITVELQGLTWAEGKTKLTTAFSSKTAPDLVELGSDWIAQFSSEGVLVDQAAMPGDSISRFPDYIAAPGRWKEGIYAWPWTTDTRVLFVNTGLLAAAGIDTNAATPLWSDVLSRAEKVSSPPNIYGFAANGSDEHRLYKKILPFFWSNGGDVLDAKGAPVVNSTQNIAALDTYLALARVGFIDGQSGLDRLFLAGKAAYWISGPWLVQRIAKENPSLHYKVIPMPGFSGGKGYSFAGGEYLAISEQSEQKEAAKKLITFLTSPAEALAFAKDLPGGTTPADLSVAGDPWLQSAQRKAFTDQLKAARMTPVHPKWLDIEAIVEQEVAEAILGRKDAKTALDAAQARLVELLSGGGDSIEEPS